MSRRLSRHLLVALAGLALLAIACSPEASRSRSGGAGGDIWNRGPTSASVDVHGPVNMFYKTPALNPAAR